MHPPHPHTILKHSPCGLHERGTAGLGLVVHGGEPLNEQLHHLVVALPTGEGERCVIVTTRRYIDLSSRVQEQLGGVQVTLPIVSVYIVTMARQEVHYRLLHR